MAMELYSYPTCPHYGKYGCTLKKVKDKAEAAITQHCGVHCRRDAYLRPIRYAVVGIVLFLLNWAIVYYLMEVYKAGSFTTTLVVTFALLLVRYYLQLWVGYAK